MTFSNQEVLKMLMHQISDYNSSREVPKLLEFVNKFDVFWEESHSLPSIELQLATSKLTGDILI